MSSLKGRVDDIDVVVNETQRLIEGAASIDRELAAGMATTETMTGIQRKLDQAAAAAEDLQAEVKAAIREGRATAA
ncbi:hypothetical protein [Amycolatopsis sp. CA-230715]|uniref:hypothetical protein n=1 Tax=Amycolatopsis sp. CA-230715 TaxID=2745196 RepID=UPI001C03A06D|nr:hypothetical protein [Amycolatopsis sp. CA-230715]QWF86078.1 hypothetical protein HUW46_09559 [Amycolatopsis sp. CA-230715]